MTQGIQRSFTGGELAPALYARVDQNKYATGARTLRNFLVMRHGGATNRAGTEHVGEVADSSSLVRLVPFVFNASQTYVLEFTDQKMRVIKSGAQVKLTSQAITGITNANPAVLTYGGADNYANGDEVYISGVVGPIAPYVNGRSFKVANVNVGANTFELDYPDGTNVNSTSWGLYTSGGTVEEIYFITTPYLQADLAALSFVQSADVITIVHPTYEPRNLSRSADTSWTLSTITFGPSQSPPTLFTTTAAGATYSYAVTAINTETREESLQLTGTSATLTSTLGWTVASGATEYNVYRALNGVYGLIGKAYTTAGTGSFTDATIAPDTDITPPVARTPFSGADLYPSAVGYYQQRRLFGNSNTYPTRVWGSQSGRFNNLNISEPLQDDDAVTFDLNSRQVNAIKWLLDLGKLIVGTSGGEWAIEGDSAGALTPTAINAKQQTYNGSATLPPLVIGGNALYVQARGGLVRDLSFSFESGGYKGNDLTIFSAHLFDGYTLADWTYQQAPHSIVWCARDDGVLLGLTYVVEHELWAWHRHDLDGGEVENVCAVPEGTEDALYLVVKRTINSKTVRYVERMATRFIDDIVDSVFTDSTLTYDGRNTGAVTMTLTSAGTWLSTDTLTLTRSVAGFTSADIGNEIVLTGDDGPLRCEIVGYTSTTVVSVRPHMTVPVSMRAIATTEWSRAVDEVTGLWHLEGEDVSITADGFVVANPNNSSYTTVTVANGVATLDRPYAVIHVGLPYLSDIETLDMDVTQGETLIGKQKQITGLTAYVESSRGFWAGRDEDNLFEKKMRSTENYNDPISLQTGPLDINFAGVFNSNGRVFIRQKDPVPLTILAVAPAGLIPVGR